MKFSATLFVIGVSLLVAIVVTLVFKDANAQTPCLEDVGTHISLSTTASNPAEFVTPDLCVNWSPPTGIVDHYHIYANGIMIGKPVMRAQQYLVPLKDTVYEINVIGVSGVFASPVGPLSGSFFVRWIDRDASSVCIVSQPAQCLSGDRVIPCP